LKKEKERNRKDLRLSKKKAKVPKRKTRLRRSLENYSNLTNRRIRIRTSRLLEHFHPLYISKAMFMRRRVVGDLLLGNRIQELLTANLATLREKAMLYR